MATTRIIPMHIGKGRTFSKAISDIIDYSENPQKTDNGRQAFVVCTHVDRAHIHNHIIWSAVNLDCDRKFRNFWGSTRAMRRLNDTICIENGYSIVENPKPHGKSYNKWLGEDKKPSQREQLCALIDETMTQNPADFDTLLKLLADAGCEVSRRGKSMRLKAPGWKGFVRMDTLGPGYDEPELKAVLSGTKAHTPKKKPAKARAEKPVNLLVDIQAKLQAGKSAGYARWAKVFNLKQMAKTVNYLSEHEADILLHKAAKAAFDEMNIKKLPTVKALQTEYAQLLEEKKKAYGEYRKAREEMQELQTAKANVDRLLGTEEPPQEREPEKEKKTQR